MIFVLTFVFFASFLLSVSLGYEFLEDKDSIIFILVNQVSLPTFLTCLPCCCLAENQTHSRCSVNIGLINE